MMEGRIDRYVLLERVRDELIGYFMFCRHEFSTRMVNNETANFQCRCVGCFKNIFAPLIS